jgi:hypothetical protein
MVAINRRRRKVVNALSADLRAADFACARGVVPRHRWPHLQTRHPVNDAGNGLIVARY